MTIKSVVVSQACVCNFNIQKVEVKGLLRVWSHSRWYSEFQNQNGMGHSVRPCLKKPQKKTMTVILTMCCVLSKQKIENQLEQIELYPPHWAFS